MTDTTGPAAPEDVIDCRGQRCPLPVIALAGRMAAVAVGSLVTVLSDDPAAAGDIPAWCRLRGQEFLGTRTVEGVTAYDVRRQT